VLIGRFAAVVAILLQLGGVARANSTGITGYYGPQHTCMNCHLPQMRKGTIQLVSPAHTGKTYIFSFTCADTTGAGGTLPVAGVDIHASCGTLATVEPGTKIANGQLIHTQPLSSTNNAKTWQFSWTAPAAPSTSCGFTIAGLLGDNNKTPIGDVTCLAMKALAVVPPPDAGPPDLPSKADSAQATDTGTATNDGAPRRDVTPSDASGAETSATDGATETDDGGCGCSLSVHPAARARTLLLGVLLVLMLRRRTDRG
jgi:hypothetical protein